MLRRLRERIIGPLIPKEGGLEPSCAEYPASHLADDVRADTVEGTFFFDVKDEIVGWTIHQSGWEAEETAYVKSILSPGDFVIDVGANLGWYTVVMARQVGEKGVVVAFEPEPRNFELLTRNVNENGFANRCKLFPTALLDRAGQCTMEKSHNNFGDHRVRVAPPENFRNYYCELERQEIKVNAESLDVVLRKSALGGKKVRLLKMDAQGSEVSIMRGAKRTLEKTECVITEFWPYGLYRAGHSADDFYACVRESFSQFARCTAGDLKFQSIEQLREDLSIPSDTPAGETIYVFRK